MGQKESEQIAVPLIRTDSGWQVVSQDGKQKLSRDNLTRAEAEKKEKELAKTKPLLLWVRERGQLKRP